MDGAQEYDLGTAIDEFLLQGGVGNDPRDEASAVPCAPSRESLFDEVWERIEGPLKHGGTEQNSTAGQSEQELEEEHIEEFEGESEEIEEDMELTSEAPSATP